jgi:hypothetical protein
VASDHDDSPDAVMDVVLADAGYASEEAHLHAEDKDVHLSAPRHKNIDPRMIEPCLQPIDRAKLPASTRGQQRLATRQGKNHYKHRGRVVEPVFGQIKTIQILTGFTRRGYAAIRREWLFSCRPQPLASTSTTPPAAPAPNPPDQARVAHHHPRQTRTTSPRHATSHHQPLSPRTCATASIIPLLHGRG